MPRERGGIMLCGAARAAQRLDLLRSSVVDTPPHDCAYPVCALVVYPFGPPSDTRGRRVADRGKGDLGPRRTNSNAHCFHPTHAAVGECGRVFQGDVEIDDVNG
ncbi:hypothetical protein D3C86_1363510 [compost metagenome]